MPNPPGRACVRLHFTPETNEAPGWARVSWGAMQRGYRSILDGYKVPPAPHSQERLKGHGQMWTVSLAECSPHTILSLSQGSRVPENHIHGVHSPPFKVTETLEKHVHGEPRWSSVSPSAQGHRDRTCRESRPSGLALGHGLPGKRLSVSRHVRPHDKHGTSFWGVN